MLLTHYPCLSCRAAFRVAGIALVILVVAASGTSASAQDGPAALTMKNLRAAIARDFAADGEVVVLMNPGVALDPWADPDAVRDRETLSGLLDQAVRPTWLYRPGETTVSGVYRRILDEAEWAAVPLNAPQRKELDKLAALLFADRAVETPTADYQQYLDLKSAYDAAVAALAAAPTPKPAALKLAVKEAREDLKFKGNEHVFAPAIQRYRALTASMPAAWRAELRKRVNEHLVPLQDGGSFVETSLGPSYVTLLATPMWTRMSFSLPDLTDAGVSAQLPDSVPPGWNLWRVSDGPRHADTDAYFESALAGLTISFELAVVALDRPWLDAGVFRSRVWRWGPGPAGRPVSTGDASDPDGLMPVVPARLVLARNVQIDADWRGPELARFRDAVRRGAATGWGPFATSGHYFGVPDRPYFRALPFRSGLRIPDVQIIGWVADLVPRSPDPDPEFLWAAPNP